MVSANWFEAFCRGMTPPEDQDASTSAFNNSFPFPPCCIGKREEGRMGAAVYSCDFRHPLNAYQVSDYSMGALPPISSAAIQLHQLWSETHFFFLLQAFCIALTQFCN